MFGETSVGYQKTQISLALRDQYPRPSFLSLTALSYSSETHPDRIANCHCPGLDLVVHSLASAVFVWQICVSKQAVAASGLNIHCRSYLFNKGCIELKKWYNICPGDRHQNSMLERIEIRSTEKEIILSQYDRLFALP